MLPHQAFMEGNSDLSTKIFSRVGNTEGKINLTAKLLFFLKLSKSTCAQTACKNLWPKGKCSAMC